MRPIHLLLILVLLLIFDCAKAQTSTSVKYSSDIEHRLKVARQLERKYRQFQKDSSKILNEHFRILKHSTDSLVREIKEVEVTSGILNSYENQLSSLTSRQQQAMYLIKEQFAQSHKYSRISKKKLKAMVMGNLKDSPEFKQFHSMIRNQLASYSSMIEPYQSLSLAKDSTTAMKNLDLDSAAIWQQLDQFAESEAMKTNYYEAFMKDREQLASLQSDHQSIFDSEAPSFDFANHPLNNARQAGMKHFEQVEEALNESLNQGAEQLDLLKKKYAYMPDSEDLKKGRKSRSLEEVSFKKRLVIGGNFHVDLSDPFVIDVNPYIGYRLNRNWVTGIGGTFRFVTKNTDSTRFQYNLPAAGLRGFGEYRFFKSFLAHAEYEVLADEVFSRENQSVAIDPSHSINIGLGGEYGLYKGLKGKFLILYNITMAGETKYKSPWVIRFGFLN